MVGSSSEARRVARIMTSQPSRPKHPHKYPHQNQSPLQSSLCKHPPQPKLPKHNSFVKINLPEANNLHFPVSLTGLFLIIPTQMSFLTTRAAFTARRALVAAAPRAFSTTIVAKKTATEAVKDTLKTVDRVVSDRIVDGIELGGRCLLFLEPVSEPRLPLFFFCVSDQTDCSPFQEVIRSEI